MTSGADDWRMDLKLKLAAAAGGGLVLGGAVVAAVALVTAHPSNVAAGATPTPTSSADPSASPGTASTAARRALARASAQAEAQVLGITTKDLAADLKQGTTVHQLADQKGMTQTAFQTAFASNLTTLLDQAVSQGTITQTQETQLVKRETAHIPHWDQAAASHPSPSPSATTN
jgi:hypothetical protein